MSFICSLIVNGFLEKFDKKLRSAQDEKRPHLLRYRATGSALFSLRSLRKPEKLNVGVSVASLLPRVGIGVARGSNSERSGRLLGVKEGVSRGRSLAAGLGPGALGAVRESFAGAGVSGGVLAVEGPASIEVSI